MVESHPISSPPWSEQDALTARGRFAADCVRLLRKLIPPLWETMLAKLDDALNDLADRSTSDVSYRVYFDARQILQKKRNRLRSEFLRRVQQEAADLVSRVREQQSRLEPRLGWGDLALVAEAELEEILVIDNLVSKAESRYRQELREADRLIACLMGWSELGLAENPFGPSSLCSAFRGALGAVPELETSIKLAVYKLFDKHVMDHLGDFYRGCLNLADCDWEPGQAAAAPAPGTHDRGAGSRASGAVNGLGSGETEPAPPVDEVVSVPFDVLQGLLARQRPPDHPGSENGVVVQTTELLALLDNLDAGPEAECGSPSADGKLRERLSASLAGAAGGRVPRALAQRDADTLDLVFLFFEHLLGGSGLPDAIKTLIARMQIPVAKLALLDEAFFGDQEHPARRLLNDIGEAAVGWSEDDGRGPDSLYGMIERVIERLVLDFDGDPRLFARMDRYFRAFIARERARAQAAGAPDGDLHPPVSEPGQDVVAAAIADRLATYAWVPAVIETILHRGWARVLVQIQRTHGTDGREWQSALESIDRLLWSAQAKRDAEERRQLLRRIPGLLETLRQRLSEVGCDQREVAVWLKELQTLHLDLLQGQGRGAELATSGPEADLPVSASPECAVGDWIDWVHDDGTRLRLRLASCDPARDELAFTDRSGRVRAHLTRGGLAGLIEQGRVTVCASGQPPIADRALRALLASLQSKST